MHVASQDVESGSQTGKTLIRVGGKVVGHILNDAMVKSILIAGSFATDAPTNCIALESLAGTSEAVQIDTEHWLSAAGVQAALNR